MAAAAAVLYEVLGHGEVIGGDAAEELGDRRL